jgi:hypothetical protein
MKHTKIFHPKAFQNTPKLAFWVWKNIPSGNPGEYSDLINVAAFQCFGSRSHTFCLDAIKSSRVGWKKDSQKFLFEKFRLKAVGTCQLGAASDFLRPEKMIF